MLSLSFRADWGYLESHVEHLRIASDDPGERRGEPPGRWWGSGAEALGLTGVALAEDMDRVYGKLEHPSTGEPLGERPRRYPSYQERLSRLLETEPDADRAELERKAAKGHREARMYADLTFSPPKSWSALQAALEHEGRRREAEAVWQAWEAGVAAGLDYLMEEAGYSRKGLTAAKDRTGEWVDAHNWVVAGFRHHTSRDGEPQMHLHCAVLNRVLCEDGKWRSLDGRAIYEARAAAGAIAERVAEEHLSASLGVHFHTPEGAKAREIDGIPADVRMLFSSRREAIVAGTDALADAYRERTGKELSAYNRSLISEHVTLLTRDRKPDQAPTRAEMLAGWDRQLREALGVGFGGVLQEIRGHPDGVAGDRFDAGAIIDHAIGDVWATRSTWNRHDVVAALIHRLPDELGRLNGQQVRDLVGDLADRALSVDNPRIVSLYTPSFDEVPDELLRADGRSRFEPHRPETYAMLGEAMEGEDPELGANKITRETEVQVEAAADRRHREILATALTPETSGTTRRESRPGGPAPGAECGGRCRCRYPRAGVGSCACSGTGFGKGCRGLPSPPTGGPRGSAGGRPDRPARD